MNGLSGPLKRWAIDQSAIDLANEKRGPAGRSRSRRRSHHRTQPAVRRLHRTAAVPQRPKKRLWQLYERLEALDDALAKRAAQPEQADTLAREGDALAEKIGSPGEVFDAVHRQGQEASGSVAKVSMPSTRSLWKAAKRSTERTWPCRHSDASVRLLELIQASAHQLQRPAQCDDASEERLAAIEARAREVHSLLDQARQAGEQASASMDTAGTRRGHGRDRPLPGRFRGDHRSPSRQHRTTRASAAALGSENEAVATKAQEELREAIEALQTGARSVLAAIESEQAAGST